MTRALIAALLLAPISGCLEADGDNAARATLRLGGAFTANATQEDLDEFSGFMAARGGDTAILESFPMQFAVSGLSRDGCPLARADAAARAYVARVGECVEETASASPEEPTASAHAT